MTDSNGRPVVDVEYESNRDGSVYTTRAWYADDGSEVPEEELLYLDETYPEVLEEVRFDRAIGIAEAYYEGDR